MARVTFHLRVGNVKPLICPKLLSLLLLLLRHLLSRKYSSYRLVLMVQRILLQVSHLQMVLLQQTGGRSLHLHVPAHITLHLIGLLQRCLCD